jgi:hypothetical protein
MEQACDRPAEKCPFCEADCVKDEDGEVHWKCGTWLARSVYHLGTECTEYFRYEIGTLRDENKDLRAQLAEGHEIVEHLMGVLESDYHIRGGDVPARYKPDQAYDFLRDRKGGNPDGTTG